MSSHVKAAILLTAAFLLGTAVGALGHAIFQGRWGSPAPEMRLALGAGGTLLIELDKELNLTPAQREKIKELLREALRERARLRAELGPRFNDLHARFRARIYDVLDAEQQQKFEAFVARRKERVEHLLGPPDAPVPAPR